MERQAYQVGAKVIECRELTVRNASGTVNPFVKIWCAQAEPQITGHINGMASATWNKTFSFTDQRMNRYELEQFELIFEVYDHHEWSSHELIGLHKIGLSTLYRSPNHQLNNKWLPLTHQDHPMDVQGYLKVTCVITGRYERLKADLDGDDQNQNDENEDEYMYKDAVEIEAMRRDRQGLKIIKAPDLNLKSYQLITQFYKGEDMPKVPGDSGHTCDIYFSVHVQNFSQTTSPISKNSSDTVAVNQKVLFPVTLPSFNDKIKISMWYKKAHGHDQLLANLPEFPTALDGCNIPVVQGLDGRMAPFWVPLYSVGLGDRKKLTAGQLPVNSTYMGRVLISIHLQQNLRPQWGIQPVLLPPKEPDEISYALLYDLFEFVPTGNLGSKQIEFSVRLGGYTEPEESGSEEPFAYCDPKTGTFKWTKNNTSSGRVIKAKLEERGSNIPEVIVSLYQMNSRLQDKTRIGYIRLPTKDLIRNAMDFKWHNVVNIGNKYMSCGVLLANFQLIKHPKEYRENKPVYRGKAKAYLFFAQIISGFGLAPEVLEKNLKTRVEIDFGVEQGSKMTTNVQKGRFPFYKFFKQSRVEYVQNLTFAADLSVSVIQEDENMVGTTQRVIGKFIVPISSIGTLWKKPQFFNIIDEKGNMLGKILARFYISLMPSSHNKLSQHSKVISDCMLKLYQRPVYRTDINMSVIGIRSLTSMTFGCSIKVWLTDHLGAKKAKKHHVKKGLVELQQEYDSVDSLEMEGMEQGTFDPNFLQLISLKDIELAEDPMLWPLLRFEVTDKKSRDGYFIRGEQMETCFSVIPLIEFQPDVHSSDMNMQYSPNNIAFTLGLMQRGQTSVEMLIQNPDMKPGDLVEDSSVQILPLKQSVRDPMSIFAETIWANHVLREAQGLKGSSILTGKAQEDLIWNHEERYDESFLQNLESQLWRLMQFDSMKEDLKILEEGGAFKEEKDDGFGLPRTSLAMNRPMKADLDSSGEMSMISEEDRWDDAVSNQGDNSMALLRSDQKLLRKQDTSLEGKINEDLMKILSFDGADNCFEMAAIENLQGQFEIETTQADQDAEKKKRHKQYRLYTRLIERVEKIQSNVSKSKNSVTSGIRAMLKEKERMLTSIIQQLEESEVMDEQRFCAFDDYVVAQKSVFGSRPIDKWVQQKKVLRNELVEDGLVLPFKDFLLLEEVSSYWDNSTVINGVHQAGRPTGAFIRAVVQLEQFHQKQETETQTENSSSSETEAEKDDSLIVKKHTATSLLHENDMQDDDYNQVEMESLCQKILKRHQFSLVNNRDLLQYEMKRELTDKYKVHIYILACYNLTAVDSIVSIKEKLAGNIALCSADPFPVCVLGQKQKKFTTAQQTGLDIISDRDAAIDNELSPLFFRQYELEAQFPRDYRLEVSIYDRGDGIDGDTLIGSTVIDLEKRRLGNMQNQAEIVLSLAENELNGRKGGVGLREMRQLGGEMTKIQNERHNLNMLSSKSRYSSPIEFRPLYNPLRSQTQGLIEMWVDVLSKDEAKNNPPQKLTPLKELQDYEVRLIIWETADVPLVDGSSVDIFIRAKYYADGFDDVSTATQTDVHFANTTGRGKFNYRMKFQVKMPASYPRIMLGLGDYGMTGDESIGETNLNIKDSIMLFVKEGAIPDNKIWVAFSKPNEPECCVGYALISMSIVTSDEAELHPVGEAQNEPNVNPVLVKPTEGRAYSEQMAANMNGIIPNFELPKFDFYRNIFIILIVIIVIAIIMFLMMFFK